MSNDIIINDFSITIIFKKIKVYSMNWLILALLAVPFFLAVEILYKFVNVKTLILIYLFQCYFYL